MLQKNLSAVLHIGSLISLYSFGGIAAAIALKRQLGFKNFIVRSRPIYPLTLMILIFRLKIRYMRSVGTLVGLGEWVSLYNLRSRSCLELLTTNDIRITVTLLVFSLSLSVCYLISAFLSPPTGSCIGSPYSLLLPICRSEGWLGEHMRISTCNSCLYQRPRNQTRFGISYRPQLQSCCCGLANRPSGVQDYYRGYKIRRSNDIYCWSHHIRPWTTPYPEYAPHTRFR